MCKLQLRLKKSQGKAETKPQIDIEALKKLNICQAFREELDKRLEQLGDGYQLNNLRFADDIDLMEERPEKLQANIKTLHTAGEEIGLRMNIGKTMTLVFGSKTIE